jgi:hypothetical protein
MPNLTALDILRHGRRRGWHRFIMALMFPFGLRPTPKPAAMNPCSATEDQR